MELTISHEGATARRLYPAFEAIRPPPRLRVSLISGLAPSSVLFDSLAPAQFALRANLWVVYLVPTHALDCVLGGQKSPLKKPKIFLQLKSSAQKFQLSVVLDLNP